MKLVKLQEILKEEEYKFIENMRDYHSGQSYMNAYAYLNNEIVGRVDFSIYDKKLYIDMIEVEPEYRRKGIATKLMDFVKKENPNLPIIPGYSTEEGHKFWEKYRKGIK